MPSSLKNQKGLGQVAEIDAAGRVTFIHSDVLGSAMFVSDEAGSVVQQYDYDPFGVLIGSLGAADGGLGRGTRYQFTGQEFDSESSLGYFNARYYSPALGRFLSRDSFLGQDGDTLGRNRYNYVKNNPFKYVDPTGNEAEESQPQEYGSKEVVSRNLVADSGEIMSDVSPPKTGWLEKFSNKMNFGVYTSNYEIGELERTALGIEQGQSWIYGKGGTLDTYLQRRGNDLSRAEDCFLTGCLFKKSTIDPNTIDIEKLSNQQLYKNRETIWINAGGLTKGDAAMIMGIMGGGGAGKMPKGTPKPSPKFITPTNPPQLPPKVIPKGLELRIMKPTQQYPTGYWKLEVPMSQGGAQGINPSTMKPGSHPETHIPLPPGYWK